MDGCNECPSVKALTSNLKKLDRSRSGSKQPDGYEYELAGRLGEVRYRCQSWIRAN
jgi:hypothetical protein